jgi:membrane associated rhomboid family serine protease
MDYYRPPSFSLFPPVVKNLLIANTLFFIATLVVNNTYHIDLNNILGLHYFQASTFKPYQLVTYMFMHGGFAHILFNMFALWMFGYSLENLWGPKRFLFFYFVCGIGAGLTQEFVQYFYFHHIHQALEVFSSAPNQPDFTAIAAKYFGLEASGGETFSGQYMVLLLQKAFEDAMSQSVTIGASGAIFGILLAFGMLFPNTLLYVYLFVPVKAKYFVIVYGLIELFSAVSNRPGDDVAHYAHIGGMVFGFFLIMYWRRKRDI